MSSPARSSVSATSGGAAPGGGGVEDPSSSYHHPPDLVSAHDRKEEALAALTSELMAGLEKEVKWLDEESWKFTKPRSQIHRIGNLGWYLQMQSGRPQETDSLAKETRQI